jgi:uncharacterized peroxidase-related enzyme
MLAEPNRRRHPVVKLHDQDTAPIDSKAVLAGVGRANGFIPNMFRAISNSPSTLNGFAAALEANDRGTLSPAERQIVQLTASIENQGVYCVAGHSTFAEKIGMSRETIIAIRDGRALRDDRYQGLVDFTRALVRNRGHVTEADIAAFEASGFRAEQIFEVIAGIALKTITNYVGSVFDLPLDEQFRTRAWKPSGDRQARHPSNGVAA